MCRSTSAVNDQARGEPDPFGCRSALRLLAVTVLFLLGASGCSDVRIEVDCRAVGDAASQSRLDGPAFVMHAESEIEEASLAFAEFSGMLERVLIEMRPKLQRVPAGAPAALHLTIVYSVGDQGVGMAERPIYGPMWGYGGCYGRPYRAYGVVGTQVYTYHRGFVHLLIASAWIPEASQPAGRRVLWEGRAVYWDDQPDLRATFPYLAAGLGSMYGQSVTQPMEIKIEKDDPLLLAAKGLHVVSTQPAVIHPPATGQQ